MPPGPAAGGAHLAAAILAMVLPLAAVAAAAAAARALVQRRLRQRRAAGRQLRPGGEHDRLLGVPAHGGQRPAGARHHASGRRARVNALLRGRGINSRSSLAMLPLATLPAGLAHEMAASGCSKATGSGLPAASRGSGGIEMQRLLPAAGNCGSMGMPADMLDSWVEASASSTAPARGWRLDTHSLQLGSSEIEVGGWRDGGGLAMAFEF